MHQLLNRCQLIILSFVYLLLISHIIRTTLLNALNGTKSPPKQNPTEQTKNKNKQIQLIKKRSIIRE